MNSIVIASIIWITTCLLPIRKPKQEISSNFWIWTGRIDAFYPIKTNELLKQLPSNKYSKRYIREVLSLGEYFSHICKMHLTVWLNNLSWFVLPFALAIGKLLELCGFFERNGAAEKKQSPSDPMLLLGFYRSSTSLQGLNCPTTCHTPL